MFVLTEFEKKKLLFKDPRDIIACSDINEVEKCFVRMEEALKKGFYLAGFLSYEAGHAFEERVKGKSRYEFPLIYIGVFDEPEPENESLDKLGTSFSVPLSRDAKMNFRIPFGSKNGCENLFSRDPHTWNREFYSQVPVNSIATNVHRQEYYESINKIRSYIASGDVYQITYCIKYKFDYSGEPFALYEELKRKQPVPYPAYIDADDFQIASLSPELFLKKNGGFIMTKPMKGTWFRGKGWLDGWMGGWKLHFDPKNRAENIMICDLLRNDLGRIGENVRAPKLYEVAKYKTLFQMTSTVTANIDKNISLYKLFKAVFPTGSVTGAPKIRAMQIIDEIEKEERNIYTGAIGYITPNKDLFFNVPIRTLLIRNGNGEMGVGGGIVWDSTPEGELEECNIKARFLTKGRV